MSAVDKESKPDSLFSCRPGDSSVHLTVGAPGDELLTKLPPLFHEATSHCLSQTGAGLFQYGPELGTKQFRTELAKFLSLRYGEPVAADHLVLTCGATNGLHLVTSCLVKQGGVVFVENPTYFIALNILHGDMGLSVCPVDINQDGIDVEVLEESIKTVAANHDTKTDDGRYWGMIYTIPTYHNPTGITMTQSVGENLIKIAKKYNLLVLCDDVYNLLSYDELPFSRLKCLDKDFEVGNVISNGTFSKILAPGVRMGWLEAPSHVVKKLKESGVLLSGGSQNNLMSGTVTSLLQLGSLDRLLDESIKIYKERMDEAVDILQHHLPSNWTVKHPGGGYFLWIETDVNNIEDFTTWLQQEKNLVVMKGQLASPFTHLQTTNGNCFSNCFRISIAYYELKAIVSACRHLCDAAKQFIAL